MYKVLVRRKDGTWKEVKTTYDRSEAEDYAMTQLVVEEFMVVSVVRHHSGYPEEYELY